MQTEPNPWVGKTYIPDNLRMDVPPAWFLAQLHDFDSMLVLLPSRHVPYAYVIARRKQFGPGITEAAIDAQFANPDTNMCVKHGLVPVCLMYKTGPTWDIDSILRSLKARDTWTFLGKRDPDAIADFLEQQEADEKAKIQAQIRDDMYNRSGDAWRSYQFRTGQAVGQAIRKGQQGRPASKQSSSGSTAGSGAAFVHEAV